MPVGPGSERLPQAEHIALPTAGTSRWWTIPSSSSASSTAPSRAEPPNRLPDRHHRPASARRLCPRNSRTPHRVEQGVEILDSVVIGAGQAGLSSSFHLRRRGIEHVVLDSNAAAGGAWQHRWRSLTMHDVHGVAALPDLDVPIGSDREQARTFVPALLPRLRGDVRPTDPEADPGPGRTRRRRAADRRSGRSLVDNAHPDQCDGHLDTSLRPALPGQETFLGRQLHTVDYNRPEERAGLRVVVVGGGASAVQLLGEIAPVAPHHWVTRRPPVWRTKDFTPELGRAVVAKVEERVRQGCRRAASPASPVSALRAQEREAERLGAYDRRPMFARSSPTVCAGPTAGGSRSSRPT